MTGPERDRGHGNGRDRVLGPDHGPRPGPDPDGGPAPEPLSALASTPGLGEAFARYEEALVAGDVAGQREAFWSEASVVRVDGDGPVTGPDALAAFRARRPTPGPRRLRDLHVVHSPGDTVVTVSVNERLDAAGRVTGLSTQTQVWARTEAGWRVIAACVSSMSGT